MDIVEDKNHGPCRTWVYWDVLVDMMGACGVWRSQPWQWAEGIPIYIEVYNYSLGTTNQNLRPEARMPLMSRFVEDVQTVNENKIIKKKSGMQRCIDDGLAWLVIDDLSWYIVRWAGQ